MISTPHGVLPGAFPDATGTRFAVHTTTAKSVEIRVGDASFGLVKEGPHHVGHAPGVRAGDRYTIHLDGEEVPDPYARFLPEGVHGPAEVVPRGHGERLARTAADWTIYELHVGAFTPEGTFRSAIAKLEHLASLGVTAIEVMPIAAFPGERGWGYDGVALYAPFAPYGSPDDVRAFVRAAHERGLAVILDVVYNHFGPAGNYLSRYAPEYFTDAIKTPWGPAPDFTNPAMRGLVLENVRYWLEEFGFDGLRLDAVHAIQDPSPTHVLREIVDLAHGLNPPARIFFEDERNEPSLVDEIGADGVWADDFHHQVHVLLTKEKDGYYQAYEPTLAALATCIRRGWTYSGQPFAPWSGKPRGKPASALSPRHLVTAIQTHDQVGNRAFGTRLDAHAPREIVTAAFALLAFLPTTPLLFMGEEWGASSPFLFFTDHESALGEAISTGRREEFAAFAAFADPALRAKIPDPQAAETFAASKLRWEEIERAPHAAVLAAYRALLGLRRTDPVLRARASWSDVEVIHEGEVLEVTRRSPAGLRRFVMNLGERPSPATYPGRALFTVGHLTKDGGLGPRSAAIFASDGPDRGS